MSKHSNINIGSKKAMTLLISVTAFSVILCCSSLLLPFLKSSLCDVYVSAFSKKSFSSTLEKNCVFLLFNGLLVIIVKNSGLIGKSPERLDTNNGVVLKSALEKASPLALQGVVLEDDDEEDEKKGREQTGQFLITFEREEKEEEEVSVMENELGERVEVEKRIIVFENFENEEEGTIELPSTEEFNKKCEDFIRRVKQEIKYGGR